MVDEGQGGGKRRICMIAEPSKFARRKLVHALREHEYAILEAANLADVLHYLTKVKIPDVFVINHSLDRGRGSNLVIGLSTLEKTRARPVVLLGHPASSPFPRNAVPLGRLEQLSDLLAALDLARDRLDGRDVSIPLPVPQDSLKGAHEAMQSGIRRAKGLEHALRLHGDIIERIKKNLLPGPVTPTFLSETRRLLANSSTTFRQLGDFVKKHQSASARLLGTANSAFFRKSTGERIRDLEEAVQRIGLRQVGQILQTIAMRAYLVGKDPALRKLIARYLRRGVMVAYLSEEIAKHGGLAEAPNAYTVGLFHNIGATFFVYTVALLNDKGEIGSVDEEALRDVLETRTDVLTRMIADHLEFPNTIRDALLTLTSEQLMVEPVVEVVRQAGWAADVIEAGETTLAYNNEAFSIGIESELIDLLNEKLPLISEALSGIFDE